MSGRPPARELLCMHPRRQSSLAALAAQSKGITFNDDSLFSCACIAQVAFRRKLHHNSSAMSQHVCVLMGGAEM